MHNVSKYYGKFKALSSLTLNVEENQIYAFIGPNGAGKSTAIRLMLGILNPSEGYVEVLGKRPTQKNVKIFKNMGYLPGELSTYQKLTGNEVLKFFSSLRNIDDDQYIRNLIERLDYDPNKYIKELSKGNKQKLGLILAFMHKPELLILDEPSSGLDPLMQQITIELIQEARQNGSTIFLSSHIFSEIDKVAERVGFVKEGKLIVEESLEVLKSNAMKSIVIYFKETIPLNLFDNIKNVNLIETNKNVVKLNIIGPIDEIIKVISKYEIIDLTTQDPTLEELFMNYY
jgi:ABC-2 type transport system ATP-binding protein|tara:strand:+ start:910 stop:1770 length:861 start_codon:yes stop_codon:yes gene_type:complete